MKIYVLHHLRRLVSTPVRLPVALAWGLAFAALASSLTPAYACSVACRSYEAEVAASDLVFYGRVMDVRIDNGRSIATIQPVRWIKGFTRSPIIAIAPIGQTRTEQQFGCPGPIRVTPGTMSVFGALRRQDGGGYNVRTDHCVNVALNTPGNRDNANSGRFPTAPPQQPPRVSQWTPHGITSNPDSPPVAMPDDIVPALAQPGLSDMTFTSASCMKQGGVGHASCAAICPPGQLVLHCSHSAGNLSGGDTCTSLGRVSSIGAVASGQPQPQPHDRCVVSAVCTDQRATLSVQGWATCYPSNRAGKSTTCETVGSARSPKNGLSLRIAMRNSAQRPRTLNWIDFDGNAVQIKVLAPGEEYSVRTAPGHIWTFVNQRGECQDVYVAGVGERRFDVEK